MIGLSSFLLVATSPEQKLLGVETAELFQKLCIDGQAELSASTTKKIRFSKLPSMMRKQLKDIGSPVLLSSFSKNEIENPLVTGNYFSLGTGPDKDYLAIEERQNSLGKILRSCSVGSTNINFENAVRSLDPNTSVDISETRKSVGPNSNFRSKPTSWSKPFRSGYFLTVNRLNARRILMTSTITGSDEVQRTRDEIDRLKERYSKQVDK